MKAIQKQKLTWDLKTRYQVKSYVDSQSLFYGYAVFRVISEVSKIGGEDYQNAKSFRVFRDGAEELLMKVS